MPHSAQTPNIRVIASARRTHPVALAVFLLVYLGLMAVVFAPDGMLSPLATPAAPAAPASILR